MLHDIASPVLINRDCTVALSNRIYKEMSNPSLLQSEEEEIEEQEKCKKGLQLLKVCDCGCGLLVGVARCYLVLRGCGFMTRSYCRM